MSRPRRAPAPPAARVQVSLHHARSGRTGPAPVGRRTSCGKIAGRWRPGCGGAGGSRRRFVVNVGRHGSILPEKRPKNVTRRGWTRIQRKSAKTRTRKARRVAASPERCLFVFFTLPAAGASCHFARSWSTLRVSAACISASLRRGRVQTPHATTYASHGAPFYDLDAARCHPRADLLASAAARAEGRASMEMRMFMGLLSTARGSPDRRTPSGSAAASAARRGSSAR